MKKKTPLWRAEKNDRSKTKRSLEEGVICDSRLLGAQ